MLEGVYFCVKILGFKVRLDLDFGFGCLLIYWFRFIYFKLYFDFLFEKERGR